MTARLSITLVFLASLGLAGCGKLGDLEQPAPLYGAQAKADYEAQKHAQDAARARAQAAGQPAPQDNGVDSSGPQLQEAPFAAPIPGRTDTFSPEGPPTALPTPGQPAANQ